MKTRRTVSVVRVFPLVKSLDSFECFTFAVAVATTVLCVLVEAVRIIIIIAAAAAVVVPYDIIVHFKWKQMLNSKNMNTNTHSHMKCHTGEKAYMQQRWIISVFIICKTSAPERTEQKNDQQKFAVKVPK